MRRILGPFLPLAVFIAFELFAMVWVYGICKLLAALGAGAWVFPVWLLGIPAGFYAAILMTVRFCPRKKLR